MPMAWAPEMYDMADTTLCLPASSGTNTLPTHMPPFNRPCSNLQEGDRDERKTNAAVLGLLEFWRVLNSSDFPRVRDSNAHSSKSCCLQVSGGLSIIPVYNQVTATARPTESCACATTARSITSYATVDLDTRPSSHGHHMRCNICFAASGERR